MLPRDAVARDGRPYRIRLQRDGDAAAIAALDPEAERSLLEEQLELTALGVEQGLGVVAETLGTGVFAHLVVAGPRRPDGGGEIAIYVHNEWRRGGVGRALLDLAIEWARIAGLAGVHVHANQRNAAAIRLYAATGFRLVDESDPARLRLELPL